MSGRAVRPPDVGGACILPALKSLSLNDPTDGRPEPAEESINASLLSFALFDTEEIGTKRLAPGANPYANEDGEIDTVELVRWLIRQNADWLAFYPPKPEEGAEADPAVWTSWDPTPPKGQNVPPSHPDPHFMRLTVKKSMHADLEAAIQAFVTWMAEWVTPEQRTRVLEAIERGRATGDFRDAAATAHEILGGKKTGNMVEVAEPGQKKKFVNIAPPPGWVPFTRLTNKEDAAKKKQKWIPDGETLFYGPTLFSWREYQNGETEDDLPDEYGFKKAKTVRTAWYIYLGWILSDSALDVWVKAKRKDADPKLREELNKSKAEKKAAAEAKKAAAAAKKAERAENKAALIEQSKQMQKDAKALLKSMPGGASSSAPQDPHDEAVDDDEDSDSDDGLTIEEIKQKTMEKMT